MIQKKFIVSKTFEKIKKYLKRQILKKWHNNIHISLVENFVRIRA